MLWKLAALGALGYLAYNYYRKTMVGGPRQTGVDESPPNVSDPRVALAGGPLSEQAMVVEAGQPLPAG